MRSACAAVDRRCAIKMDVRPRIMLVDASTTAASVSGSRVAVASSSNNTWGSTSSARASATSWRWPEDKARPRSPTSWLKPCARPSITGSAPTARAASTISSARADGRPYPMLYATVPVKRCAAWGTYPSVPRHCARGNSRISVPLAVTRPESGS